MRAFPSSSSATGCPGRSSSTVRCCSRGSSELRAALKLTAIRYADVYSVLTLSDLYDGVHPTQAAHAKIATVWTQALAGIATCSTATPYCAP